MSLKDVLRKKINDCRIDKTREWADKQNSYCAYTTLAEISTFLGSSEIACSPSQIQARSQRYPGSEQAGAIKPGELFQTIELVAEDLGLEIEHILIDSTLDAIQIPGYLLDKSERVKGRYYPKYPHMRVLLKKGDDNIWHSHSETDDGFGKRRQRINDLEKRGWVTGAVITFKSRR